jgi:hypothetical protein
MLKWTKIAVLVLLVLVAAMTVKQIAVQSGTTVANTTGPVPPTPWLIANTTGPVPPTPWTTQHTTGPVPPTPWSR